MDGTSFDAKQNNLETLRELFPHVFSEDKIDMEKFNATFSKENIYFNGERYTLNWAGKSDAFKILQEGTTATLKPQPELSVNFDTAENVFIEGENLEVLKVLQKSYYNKIKCIIIDPPYNTGSSTYEITFPNKVKWKPVEGTFPRLSKESLLKAYEEGRLWLGKDGKNVPRLKKYLSEVKDGIISNSVWMNEVVGSTQLAKENLKRLLENNVFDTPKPVDYIIKMLRLGTEKNSIILDFFAGSGSTAHAVLNLNKENGGNRKFILVQLPEQCDKDSEAYKAGYKTIADISRERIRRVIQKIGDGGFKSYKLSPSNFKVWRNEEITEENLEHQMEMFIDPVKPESEIENMLTELIVKSGYQLTDKIENRGNTALQMRDAGVELRVV